LPAKAYADTVAGVGPLRIGAASYITGLFWKGLIDDVSLQQVTLLQSFLTGSRYEMLGVRGPALFLYDSSGTTILDSVSTGPLHAGVSFGRTPSRSSRLVRSEDPTPAPATLCPDLVSQ